MRIHAVVPSRGTRASEDDYDGSLANKKSSLLSLSRQKGKKPTLILHPSLRTSKQGDEIRYRDDEEETERTARHANRSQREDPDDDDDDDDIRDHDAPASNGRRKSSKKKRVVQVMEPNSLSLERPHSERIFREHKELKKDDSRRRPSSARSLPTGSHNKGKGPKEKWMKPPDEVVQDDVVSETSSTDEYLKNCERWGKYKVDRHSLVESKLVAPDAAGADARLKPRTRSYSDLGIAVWRDEDEEEDSEPDWDPKEGRKLNIAVLPTNPYDDATLTSLEMVDYDPGRTQLLTEDDRFDYTAHTHTDSDEESSEETDSRFERERQKRKKKWIKNGKRAQQRSSRKPIPKQLPGKPKKVVVHDHTSTETVSTMTASVTRKGRAAKKAKKKGRRLDAVDEDYEEEVPVATKKKSLNAYRKKSIVVSSDEDLPVATEKKKSRDAYRKQKSIADSSSSEEDAPVVASKKSRRNKVSRQEDTSSEEDPPVATKKKSRRNMASRQEDSSSDGYVPAVSKKKVKKKSRGTYRKKASVSSHEDTTSSSGGDERESESQSQSETQSESQRKSQSETQSDSESKTESKTEDVDESDYDEDDYSDYGSESSGSLSLRAQNEFRMKKRREHQRWLEERDRRNAAMLKDDCSTSESYTDEWDDYEERVEAKRVRKAKSRRANDNSSSSNRLKPSKSTQSHGTQTSIEESSTVVRDNSLYPRPSRSTQTSPRTSIREYSDGEEENFQESSTGEEENFQESGKVGFFGRLRRAILPKGANREATEHEGENSFEEFEEETPDKPAQEPLPWEVEEPDPPKKNKRMGRPPKEGAAVRSVHDLPFPGSDSMDESLLALDDKYKDILDQLPQASAPSPSAASIASASVTVPDKKRPALWRAKKGLGNKLKAMFK